MSDNNNYNFIMTVVLTKMRWRFSLLHIIGNIVSGVGGWLVMAGVVVDKLH